VYEQEVDSVVNGRVRWNQAEIRSRRKSPKKNSVNITIALAKLSVAKLSTQHGDPASVLASDVVFLKHEN
jgi:hypothetical protein